MAKSRTKPAKTGTITEFPQPESAVAVEDAPPESNQEQAPPQPSEQPAAPPKRGRGAPRKTDPPVETDFFRRVAAVPLAEWGTRVYLYLYQIEPVCDLKQSGGKAYLMRYQEPVKDEHQIMLEQGSGKYRMVLALNKISPQQSNEIARYDFEIYNPKYPPRIPREVWINDPRNRRWEALLPKEEPATPATAASTIVDAMKMVSDIRRDVRDEIGEPEEQPRASEMLETMKVAKELFSNPASTAPPAKDPLEIAVALATTMMQMKADNPVIDMYRDELKALREEMKEERAANRARETAAPANKDMLSQFIEFATSEKFEAVKKVFGFGNGDGPARSTRTTGFDVVREIAQSPFGANLGQGLGMLLSSLATAGAQANGNPARSAVPPILNAQQPNGTMPPRENDEQRITRIGQQITQPMLYEFFLKDEPGEVFAERMFDLWPEDYVFIRALGAENLVARYRQFPPAWSVIAPKEPAFIQFITEFCSWDPNEDEGPAPGPDDGVVDLESKEAGA